VDSLTHIVVGAAIGDSLLGKKIGRKAAWIGAFAKTFPDFDLFYTGLSDPKLYVCDHRGPTHSLFWEGIYAFPLAYIFFLLFKKEIKFKEWLILFLVCLWGHSLLDTCTAFGTRLLLPFTNHAFAWNSISIVDLTFTLPLLVMVVIGLSKPNRSSGRSQWIIGSLVYFFFYIGLNFTHKFFADRKFKQNLEAKHIPFTKTMSNPTMLNNLMWYGIAVDDSTLTIGELTLLNPSADIVWHHYPRQMDVMERFPDKKDVEILKWFGNDFTIARQNKDTLYVYCVKFGRGNLMEQELEKTFMFRYKLFKKDGIWVMGTDEPKIEKEAFGEALKDLWERIFGRRNG
jgi:inner membrane protein